MTQKQIKRNRGVQYGKTIAILIFAFSLIPIFQNCGAPVSEKEEAGFQDFAYSSKADTLGYMSCSNVRSPNPSAYFTFRLGAYKDGGLRLKDEFHNATAKMTTNKKVRFLTAGKKNRDIQMQLAIRRKSDMVAFASETQGKEGEDYAFVLPPVNNEGLAEKLVTMPKGERIRSLSGSLDSINKFEGSLNFLDSEVLEESVRTELRRGAYLALTYNPLQEGLGAGGFGSGTGDKTLALSPGDFKEEPAALDFNVAYGIGLGITFQQGNFASGHPARVMSSISQVDLETKEADPSNDARWICPSNLRFKIVRPEDVGVSINGQKLVNCNRVLDPQTPSPDLERVRRVLRIEDWYVDMNNRCIIPKDQSTSCYGEDTEIEYQSKGCGGTAACTHFFSLCYQPF